MTVTYSYDALYELPSDTSYDANGNTLSKNDSTGITAYTWDFENRLTSVILPGSGGTVSFKYDPFGRRIYKQSPNATSIFAYDGDNLVETVNASGAAVGRYSQGLNIDEPLAMLRSGTTSYYQADGLGSLTSLSNTSGALANTYTYDSFGNLVASPGSLVNNFRYTEREFDTETSLHYYRARYYDPTAGRFVSEDPVRFAAGYNFYTYAANAPVLFVDPLGLKCCDPNAEKKDIERSSNFARNAINTLSSEGYITGATHVGADTFCVIGSIRLPNGGLLPMTPDYVLDVRVDKDKNPCLYECALKHELVHKRQCMNFGASYHKLSLAEKEIPAYMMELGCYLKQMMVGGFGPYGSD